METHYRIEHFNSETNTVGAGEIGGLFSRREQAESYKKRLLASGAYAESDLRISTTDAEGRAITLPFVPRFKTFTMQR
jgi:hypothetical protein